MATCTPYLECTNKNESWESLFKRLIVEQPDGSLAVRTCCADAVVPPVELALILEWDDIANVPLCDYSDAPAPGNITVTPDAVGDNPVTWYYKVVASFITGPIETRTLLSNESSYIVGDATTEIIFDCDITDYGQDFCYIIVIAGTTSGVYTNVWLKSFTPPSTLVYYECNEIPINLMTGVSLPAGETTINSAILSIPVYQPCTPGDPTDVDNWNTFFGLPTNGTPFTSVTVVGNSVYLYGGGNMTLTNGETGYACGDIGGNPQLFEGNAHIVGIDDQAGVIVAVADACFWAIDCDIEEPTSILETCNLPACLTAGDFSFAFCSVLATSDFTALTTAGENCFIDCTSLTSNFTALTTAGKNCFSGCTSLTSDFTALTTAGENCFIGCTSLTSDFTALTTAGDGCFSGCTSLITINIPLCTALGTDCTDNSVFLSITGLTITVTCDASLLTCNAGAPDGDLCTLAANNTITVNGAPLAGCP